MDREVSTAKPGPGESLAEQNPTLAGELHPTKNGNVTAWDIKPFSSRKKWWKCSAKGHVWLANVANRSNGNGCRACAGQMLVRGENDLATLNPEIAAEWHPVLNLGLRPSDVMSGSHQRVWWECQVPGHGGYVAEVYRRTGGRGCPICRGLQVRVGVTDAASLFPHLVEEFDHAKNLGVNLRLLPASANKRVAWKCTDHGHEWTAPLYKRTSGHGCPYCSGHRILVGFNDLATVSPELARELHPSKNGEVTGADFTIWSNKRPWWMCSECGNEWKTSVGNRTKGTGCKACALRRASRIEGRLRDWLRSGPAVSNVGSDGVRVNVPWRKNKTMDLDIVGKLAKGPNTPVAVEYDGSYWHSADGAMERDLDKTYALLNAGYIVVRVRETSRSIHLGTLPLNHSNLLQVECAWADEDDEAMYQLVDEIETWLLDR